MVAKYIPKLIGTYLNIITPFWPNRSKEVTFRLLCRVKRVPVAEEGRAFLETAHTETISTEWGDSTLHRWGSGPRKILFLHGWMSYSVRWKPYIDQLDPNEFTVYALDAPGHGLSEGNSLHLEMFRKATELAVKRIGNVETLVAHSLGSLVAAYLRIHQPEIPVDRYIIMGAPSGLDAIFTYFQKLLGLSNSVMLNLGQKAKTIFKVPMEQVQMKTFFNTVTEPVWVIHETSDSITPLEPIKEALPNRANIKTYFTEGQDHNLKGAETQEKILDILKTPVRKTPINKKQSVCL